MGVNRTLQLTKYDRCVTRAFFGSGRYQPQSWFWLVIATVPLSRSFTG